MNLEISPQENRLRIEKFEWEYLKRFSVDFSPGFNVIGGTSKQAMRTAVLRLIRYSMGGSFSRLDKRLLSSSRNVSLEVLAGEEKVKMMRSCEHRTALINVTDESNSYKLESRDLAGEYLMKKLRLPQLIKERKEGDVRLTFNDLARSFTVDRDISYSEILNKVVREDRIQIMKIMLGISTEETGPLENEEMRIRGLIGKLEAGIETIKEFLNETDIPKMEVVLKLERENRSKIEQLMTEEIDLTKQIREKTARQKKSNYDELRIELLRKKEMLRNMETELSTLRYQKKRKLDLKERLKAESNRIERQISSGSVLSSFAFSICPRCRQEIDPEMKGREAQDRCMLCGREFVKKTPSTETWEKSLRDVDQNLKEIDELMEFYQNHEEKLLNGIKSLKEEIFHLGSEIEKETKEYVSESVEEFKLLSSKRIKFEKTLNKLESWKKQRKYINEVEYKILPEKKKKLGDLKIKLNRILMHRESKERRTEAFLHHFSGFMKVVADSFKSASWDWDEYLPLVNRQKHTASRSGYDLACTVIAFHYALLAMKFKEPKVHTNHPGLLIVDEPNQQNMPTETYLKIMGLMRNLAESHKDSVQVIVAATAIPEDMKEHVIEF